MPKSSHKSPKKIVWVDQGTYKGKRIRSPGKCEKNIEGVWSSGGNLADRKIPEYDANTDRFLVKRGFVSRFVHLER